MWEFKIETHCKRSIYIWVGFSGRERVAVAAPAGKLEEKVMMKFLMTLLMTNSKVMSMMNSGAVWMVVLLSNLRSSSTLREQTKKSNKKLKL